MNNTLIKLNNKLNPQIGIKTLAAALKYARPSISVDEYFELLGLEKNSFNIGMYYTANNFTNPRAVGIVEGFLRINEAVFKLNLSSGDISRVGTQKELFF